MSGFDRFEEPINTTFAQLGPKSPIHVPIPAGDHNEEVKVLHDAYLVAEGAKLSVLDKRRPYDGTVVPFNATPIGDYLVVKRIPEEEGLIVEADIAKDKPLKCEVVAVSESPTSYHSEAALEAIKAGDKILIRRYAGTEVKVEGIEYTLIMVFDVLLKLGETGPEGALPPPK